MGWIKNKFDGKSSIKHFIFKLYFLSMFDFISIESCGIIFFLIWAPVVIFSALSKRAVGIACSTNTSQAAKQPQYVQNFIIADSSIIKISLYPHSIGYSSLPKSNNTHPLVPFLNSKKKTNRKYISK